MGKLRHKNHMVRVRKISCCHGCHKLGRIKNTQFYWHKHGGLSVKHGSFLSFQTWLTTPLSLVKHFQWFHKCWELQQQQSQVYVNICWNVNEQSVTCMDMNVSVGCRNINCSHFFLMTWPSLNLNRKVLLLVLHQICTFLIMAVFW